MNNFKVGDEVKWNGKEADYDDVYSKETIKRYLKDNQEYTIEKIVIDACFVKEDTFPMFFLKYLEKI